MIRGIVHLAFVPGAFLVAWLCCRWERLKGVPPFEDVR